MRVSIAIALAAFAGLSGCGETQVDSAEQDVESATKVDSEPISNEAGTDIDAQGLPDEAPAQVAIRPVRIGFDGPDFDACGGYGEVTGLNPNGDNFLAVRGSPFVGAVELDRIESGQGVSMCDYADGWVGIVYDKTGEKDCGTGSPADSEQDYDGPCESGWVSEDFVTLLAG